VKFRCERDTLVNALATAGRAASTRSMTPVLSGVRLSTEGNQLELVGTDLDLTIRSAIEVIGLDDGACVVPARLGADIVRSLEAGAVTVEGTEDEVEISAARARFVVNTYPVADFPLFSSAAAPSGSVARSALQEALRQVVRAASTDDARPLLTGVLIERVASGVRLVATDSYRLAIRDVPGADVLPEEMDRVVVPARCLAELQRHLGGSESDPVGQVGIHTGELEATFFVGDIQISSRLLDGKFPDYEQLIPKGYPSELVIPKNDLLEAIRRVKLLVRDNTTPVRLSIRSDSLELSVNSPEVGQMSEEIDATLTGEETSVSFNPTYLGDGVEAVIGDEVTLLVTDTSKPSTVCAPGDALYRYLLMPVRVS